MSYEKSFSLTVRNHAGNYLKSFWQGSITWTMQKDLALRFADPKAAAQVAAQTMIPAGVERTFK